MSAASTTQPAAGALPSNLWCAWVNECLRPWRPGAPCGSAGICMPQGPRQWKKTPASMFRTWPVTLSERQKATT